jgi:hypothetical protein
MVAHPVSVPNEPPAEIKALIDAHINGFNTRDNDLVLGDFGDGDHHGRHCALSLVEPKCSGQLAR